MIHHDHHKSKDSEFDHVLIVLGIITLLYILNDFGTAMPITA